MLPTGHTFKEHKTKQQSKWLPQINQIPVCIIFVFCLDIQKHTKCSDHYITRRSHQRTVFDNITANIFSCVLANSRTQSRLSTPMSCTRNVAARNIHVVAEKDKKRDRNSEQHVGLIYMMSTYMNSHKPTTTMTNGQLHPPPPSPTVVIYLVVVPH